MPMKYHPTWFRIATSQAAVILCWFSAVTIFAEATTPRAPGLTEALATIVAGLCGGVVQNTPYIGHPAYKAMGARAGYTLVTGLVIGVGAAALLLFLRLAIHEALLVEGAEHEIGPDSPCPECHRIVPTMAFCPACGAARAAGSKQGRAGLARGA